MNSLNFETFSKEISLGLPSSLPPFIHAKQQAFPSIQFTLLSFSLSHSTPTVEIRCFHTKSPFYSVSCSLPAPSHRPGRESRVGQEGMTHLCSTDNHLYFLSLLLHDLLFFCSLLVSHPLMLIYLLLLSPYLLQLFIFLYPLLFSTSLLLLSLLTVTSHLHENPPTISPVFLGRTCSAVLNILCAELDAVDDNVSLIEQLYFQLCFLQMEQIGVDFYHNSGTDLKFKENPFKHFPGNSKIIDHLESNLGDGRGYDKAKEDSADSDEGKVSIIEQSCIHQMKPNGFEFYYNSGTNLNSKETPNGQFPSNSREIKLLGSNLGYGGGDGKAKEDSADKPIKEEERFTKSNSPCRKEHSCRPSEILQRDGSMRKEKEWKRTLACKLFEERMTFKLCEERKAVDGAEEMDLLWEAYEVDAHKAEKPRTKEKDAKKAVKEEVEEMEEEDDEEEVTGQLCCLQALRLSAGKMNLGVGRPSLVKISKALKGMALFHRAGRRSKRDRDSSSIKNIK